MAKIVIAKRKGQRSSGIALSDTSVLRKRVRDAKGGRKALRTLDTSSSTLDADLTYVFGRNVAAARQENKRVTGVADVAPAK